MRTKSNTQVSRHIQYKSKEIDLLIPQTTLFDTLLCSSS